LIIKVADEIERRFDDFLAAEVADTGKPISIASHIDIPRGAANFRMFADVVSTTPTESFMTPTPDGSKALNYAVRKPKGVVAVVAHRGAARRGDGRGRHAKGRVQRRPRLRPGFGR
ncbi:MAG: aldehyde dehydrogenase family protein, partial [Bosea sp. (in: a-proteobacteria)]|nr:aldehyde dehydrogenase family protein [Bosea sp. (in: a-proteobacteria)]